MSTRNYISILTLILVVFVLFQGTLAYRDYANNYQENELAEDTGLSADYAWSAETGSHPGRAAVFVGDERSAEFRTVAEWAGYAKYTLQRFASLRDYLAGIGEGTNAASLILVEGSQMNGADTAALSKLEQEDCVIVLTSLPDVSFLHENPEMIKLLGIEKIEEDSIEANGLHLHEGFLLGGERFYEATDEETAKRQDLTLSMPWFLAGEDAEIYMNGAIDTEKVRDAYGEYKEEYLPAVIWRYDTGKSRVFAVAGDYMQDRCIGMGILYGALAKASSCAVYPVINAQNAVLSSFPTATYENNAKMREIYGMSMMQVETQLMLPQLQTLSTVNGSHLTACFTPALGDLNQGRREDRILDTMMKQFREMSCELGVSLTENPDMTVRERAASIQQFLGAEDISYRIGASLVDAEDLWRGDSFLDDPLFNRALTLAIKPVSDGNAATGRTVISLPLVGYYTEKSSEGDHNLTIQQIPFDASEYTFHDDLALLGVESALAYTNWSLDTTRALQPESTADEWQTLSKNMIQNMSAGGEPFGSFAQTSLSQSDAAIRRFLNLDYEAARNGNAVTLVVWGVQDAAYFLFRTNGEEIMEVQGADVTTVEDGVYLLHVTGKTDGVSDAAVTVWLK